MFLAHGGEAGEVAEEDGDLFGMGFGVHGDLTVNLEPVYGIILALLILGDSEHMNTEFYYGAAIIIVTVIANGIIKNRLQRKKRRLPNT